MKDKNKTKAQLIDELLEMRQRVSELESSESERTRELAKSETRYRQLVENPLVGVWQADIKGRFVFISKRLAEMSGYSQDEVIGMSMMVPIAPDLRSWLAERMQKRKAGMLPPEVVEAEMVRKDGSRYTALVAPATLYDEEEKFNGFIGSMIDITERKQAKDALQEKDQKLERQAQHLKEVNIALNVLLEHREEEKKKIEENILSNLQKLIFPYIKKLERSLKDDKNKPYIDIIKSNLKELTSPFANTLSSKYAILTSTEIQVADHIRHGRTSKEISSLLNMSINAVSFHRANIRKKLGLSNKKINLRSHLQSLAT